jgi:hypothetical protein
MESTLSCILQLSGLLKDEQFLSDISLHVFQRNIFFNSKYVVTVVSAFQASGRRGGIKDHGSGSRPLI